MAMDMTVEAVRLGLDMASRRAEIATQNVAHANMPGTHLERGDFSQALGLLDRVADGADVRAEDFSGASVDAMKETSDQSISLDDEVGEMALASAHYQALSEALNRQFGLMSLALSGDQS